jgi:glycosyltransferase involved in cell wall biosynthesis
MAHILIAYKQFPAPSVGHAGGESLFWMMEALHRRGHRLTLVARITAEERVHLPAVEAICTRIYLVPHHRSRSGPQALAVAQSYLDLRSKIKEVVATEQPDFVHVETTQTALAAAGLRLPPSSYRTQDVNWFLIDQSLPRLRGVERAIAHLKRAFFRRLEPWISRHYELVLAISEGDRRLLAESCDDDHLLLVPLVPAVDPEAMTVPAIDGEANVLFVGAMSRHHNQTGIAWFLDEVWERIATAVPEARLYIVGGHPPESLTARADGDRVIVTGFVDDLEAWYRSASVFVSPLLVAGGLLQKVMDAMAMGVPVVATSVCNHGVGATPGVHLITADEPEAFAEAVIALLEDSQARLRLGGAAQAFVSAHYDLEPAVDDWSAAIQRQLDRS